jgi:hypothetical protein
MISRICRTAVFSACLVGLGLIVLPYLGPIGWRLSFLLHSIPDYPNRLLDRDFWEISWAMSGDMVAGDVDGRYLGFEFFSLLRICALVLLGLLAIRIPLRSLYVPAICVPIYLYGAWTASISFDWSREFWCFLATFIPICAFCTFSRSKNILDGVDRSEVTTRKDPQRQK